MLKNGLLLVLIFLLSGCGRSLAKKKRDTAQLESCLSILTSLQVKAYRNQDWCKNLVYYRGKFSSQNMGPCNLFLGQGKSFDEEAQSDFNIITETIRQTGIKVMWITVAYNSDKKMTKAEFALKGFMNRYSYVYFPKYKTLPKDIPHELEHTAINSNWYWVWEDWN